MTPLGLNATAAPGAAALFPLSAAIPPAAERSSSTGSTTSTAFGDLLAASFSQAEQPVQQLAGADDAGPAFNTLSLADIWFAGLNVDLGALNAGIEAEEAGTPADAIAVAGVPIAVAGVPVDDATGDDEEAALMALGECLAAAPALQPIAVPVDGSVEPGTSSDSQLQALLAGPIVSGAPAIASASTSTAPAPVAQVPAPVGPALSGRPGEPEGLAPQAQAAVNEPVAGKMPVDTTRAVGHALANALGEIEAVAPQKIASPAAQSPQSADVQQELAAASTAPQAASVVEEPAASLRKVIDVVPAQQTGRTGETAPAKLVEMTGPGQSADAAPKTGPETNFLGDSESQTQDGGAQDAFVASITDNTAAVRSPEAASVAPVFAVAPSVDRTARAATVQAAPPPQAPATPGTPAPENVGRLIESMKTQMRDGIQEATIRLKPEHLGEVTISIRVERGAVSAVVHTETASVQQWLESQEGKLRTGLSEQGLHLERFMVHRDGTPQQREQQRQQQQAPRYRQPQRDDAPIRFEVIV